VTVTVIHDPTLLAEAEKWLNAPGGAPDIIRIDPAYLPYFARAARAKTKA
jgi:hypothetical protein